MTSYVGLSRCCTELPVKSSRCRVGINFFNSAECNVQTVGLGKLNVFLFAFHHRQKRPTIENALLLFVAV